MGGGMPYQLEKGPYFSIAEAVLSDIELRMDILTSLRNGMTFDSMPTLGAASLDQSPANANTHAKRLRHQNKHWFGKRRDDKGNFTLPQMAFDIDSNPTTGYWYNWYGDAEEIMRQVFLRAIEVSLGIEPDATIPSDPPRKWPIEVFWRCPAPWFEGWVTWREEDASPGSGHVTVHLHTPSHQKSALLLSPIRNAPDDGRSDYRDRRIPAGPHPLTTSKLKRGMWVVAHEEQRQHLDFTRHLAPSPKGRWQYPKLGPLVESSGPVVVVQPNEADGGVLADGRPFA